MSMIGKKLYIKNHGYPATCEVLDKIMAVVGTKVVNGRYQDDFSIVTKYLCKVIACPSSPGSVGGLTQVIPADIIEIIE